MCETDKTKKAKCLSYANAINEIPIHDFLSNDNTIITLHLIVLEIAMDPSSKIRAGRQSLIKVIYVFNILDISDGELPDFLPNLYNQNLYG